MTVSPFSVSFQDPVAVGGWRFACKEMFDVIGHPATCGHPRFAASRQGRPTSRVVTHFLDAGATLIGKTLQSELAFSGLGENPHYPMPTNPTRAGNVVGGSSAGCAVAVARGLVAFSVATDTAGSARIPAACCDVVGVSLAGHEEWLRDAVRLSPTLDQLGIIAVDVACARAAIKRLGDVAVTQPPARVVVPTNLLERCSAEVRERFDRFVERLGASGVEVSRYTGPAFDEVDALQAAHGSLALAEIASSLAGFLDERDDDVSSTITERLAPYRHSERGGTAKQARVITQPLRRFRDGESSPLLLPTLPVAPALGTSVALGSLTKFANLLGESSISAPLPGAAMSVMLVAARVDELLAFADLVSVGEWAEGAGRP